MVGVTYERHASTSSASTAAYEPLISREDPETSSEALHSPRVEEGVSSVFDKEFEADDVKGGPSSKARSQQGQCSPHLLLVLCTVHSMP